MSKKERGLLGMDSSAVIERQRGGARGIKELSSKQKIQYMFFNFKSMPQLN